MLEQVVVSFIASAAFSVLFNVSRKLLAAGGFVGMMGWFLYTLLTNLHMANVPATLLAAFLVTMLSHVFARLFKTPIIVFSASGIIPLVPGGVAYNAMRDFVENSYDQAIQLAAKALMTSGAIAMGLIISEVVYQVWRRSR